MASLSLLDEVGRLNQDVSTSQVAAWKQQLHSAHLPASQAAKLHLWLGEYRLAHDQEPEQALWHFQQVQKRSHRSSYLYGLAAYDTATTLFYEGAYQQAADAFHRLLTPKTRLRGYDRRTCALWFRHANACAGYHAERARLGIPEPPRLDPLCGAAALAACLRGLHRPFDKPTVLSACRVTGEGSSLQDVIDAAKKREMAAYAVTADDKALMALPKPMVAYVEHDHFIALLRADKKGVSYLCSDCGPWPGRKVDLNWKQWHALNPGLYVVVCPKGSLFDRVLPQLEEGKESPNPIARLASGSSLGRLGLQGLAQQATLLSLLKGHVLLYAGYAGSAVCGGKPEAQHCTDLMVGCPHDCNGDSGGNTSSPGNPSPFGPVPLYGASEGDPVNLATGEEEYTPPSDLVVYNPTGPSIVWKRLYNSLRAPSATYESDDFGIGWSHAYNIGVYDPGAHLDPTVPQGASNSFPNSGSEAPASGLTWDIIQGGSTVATSSSANGWTVSLSSNTFTVTAPSTASIANGYEVRYNTGFQRYSATFDVVARTTNPQVPEGGSATFASTGTDHPSATWDIIQGASTIATSTQPNGWQVGFNIQGSKLTVTAPPFATIASNYEVRFSYHPVPNSTAYASALFDVTSGHFLALAGTKYVFFANGSRLSFTAPSVPSASQPRISCTVQAGSPMQVEWDYSANNTLGYYTITFPDRSQWVTTTDAKVVNGTSVLYLLGQQRDRNGNAINFYYTTYGSTGFPLLSSITDANNTVLLTLNRATDGTGNLTSVADRYNRSIVYHVGSYATTNVPSPNPQAYQEVDHVSQVVTTGTVNPPDRWSYGYQNITNGDVTNGLAESVPFLHTITVPSPTGTGSSTATINYTANTDYVSSLVDANGNSRNYTAVDANHTQVTIKDSAGNTAYTYTAGFDSNMSQTTVTNGAGTIISSATYSDPNDPYRPSQFQDGNGYAAGGAGGKGTWNYTWDQYGNPKTVTSPYGTVTTFTWSYTNFALGELTKVQEGTKSPTTFAYYEPSGLVQSVTAPQPGTSGSASTVTMSFTYDSLGNVLTIKTPGNNATLVNNVDQGITTTFNYTTDGAYAQAAAIGQPLTVTNNLGKVTHLRYDARANPTSITDALGNETDFIYNFSNQLVQVTFPATGQTGAGRSYHLRRFLYDGGIQTSQSSYDESNTLVFTTIYSHGPEGELTSVSGGTLSTNATYDAAYRLKTRSDGNSHVTTYTYNTAGYVSQIAYPLSGTTFDTVQFTSYDNNGNPMTRVDGRNLTTNYTYNDPESRLTAISYPASTGLNVSLSYDAYGRLTSRSDGTGSTSYTFDDDNDLTEADTTYSGLPVKAITYGYYNDGLSLLDGHSGWQLLLQLRCCRTSQQPDQSLRRDDHLGLLR